MTVISLGPGDFSPCDRFSSSHGQQSGRSGKIVGGHGQDEVGAHPLDAAIQGLSHATDGLGPAESLLDPIAVLDRRGVTFVLGGSSVDRRISRFLRDMGRDPGFSQVGGELCRVEARVCAQRQPPGRSGGMASDHVQRGASFGMAVDLCQFALHDQARAVLHQRVPHEAQHRPGAGRFLVEPGLGISFRGMSGIGTLLALKIDFGSAALMEARGIGYVSGSGLAAWSAEMTCPGGSPGTSSFGGAPSAFGWKLFMDAQASTSVPLTEKCSSDKSGATSRLSAAGRGFW